MMMMTFSEPQAQPINITPMSAQEARECIAVIKGNLESLYLMLLDLHRRRGWEALGYASWEDCATEEFGRSRAYVFRLLAAAQVQENLVSAAESTVVDLKDIPVSQLTELAKLPPPQQAEGLALADQIAQTDGKKRNAAHVAQAVQEIKPKKHKNQVPTTQTDEQPPVADDADDDTGIQQPEVEERPSTTEIDTDAICTAFISHVSYLSDDQVKAVWHALVPRLSFDALSIWDDEELNQIISEANRLSQDANRKLNQRH